MSFELSGGSLYEDLLSESRDRMYRAMRYIARLGGPKIAGPADDLVNLKAHRGAMLAWLRAQDDLHVLVQDYADYRERWSPFFKD